jgi:1-deoxy-D-xylulose-5-phosphate reductoisomerase
MLEAQKYNAEIIPVDSEHSAIFQCLMGVRDKREVKKLILTCSGGPFYGMKREALTHVKRADALKHPNWKMGEKITIDCATLMNKGLEVIEAMRLYNLPLEQVDVVIHRQSIVHSFVECIDGAVLAQMGAPDMRLPIQLALTYPQRLECPVDALDLTTCGALTFAKPDMEAFPCLQLARDCAAKGGNACAVMNGANEAAVALYLQDKIGFYDIYDLVLGAVNAVSFISDPNLEQILESDRLAREYVSQKSST